MILPRLPLKSPEASFSRLARAAGGMSRSHCRSPLPVSMSPLRSACSSMKAAKVLGASAGCQGWRSCHQAGSGLPSAHRSWCPGHLGHLSHVGGEHDEVVVFVDVVHDLD